VDTFDCVHKEESWTHRIKHYKSEWLVERSGVERVRERREIVEETLLPEASVSRVARETTRSQREPGVLLAEAGNPCLGTSGQNPAKTKLLATLCIVNAVLNVRLSDYPN
jgi:hypothetical protein